MKKKSIIVITVLVIITAIIAAVHLSAREQIPEGAIQVDSGGSSSYIELSEMSLEKVSGTVVNGKGEEKELSADGASLATALSEAGIKVQDVSLVKVTADDEYSAEITGDEMRESGKVFLYQEEEGKTGLVVFGDENSKRRIHSVVKIDVQ